jgi:hypothetical protein
MEFDVEKKQIKLNKTLNNLDKFVIGFTSLLDEYVIVSGYVSILFGRTRLTEDVDLLIPKMNIDNFKLLWDKIHKNNLWCLNTSNINEAFVMLKEHAIRFARPNEPVPNIEFKIIKNPLDIFSFENKIKVLLNSSSLYVSPLELQIAYKLFLGSNKDIEDARHLFRLFDDKINKEELIISLKKLNVLDKFKLIEK